MLILLIVIILLFGGGGWYGYRQGAYGPGGFGGVLGLVVLVLVVLWLFGALGGGYHRIGGLLIGPAYADSAVTQIAAPTIDLTGIAVAATGGFFSILGLVVAAWLQSHIKDKQAAATLDAAINNSLGAMQQAATMGIKAANLTIPAPPGTPDLMRVGLQYAMDHAGDEAKHLGITVPFILSKIDARVGLANIATNLATASSPLPSPRPLDPVPLVAAGRLG